MDEQDWERYKTRMDAMQHGFLEKLSARHPELSRQQLTLCSLFRLGLVSKEAAQILSMSLEALDKSRYRIRKKIQLPPNASLENYLLQI
jgi:DNA-binding CsgD family transcriptional regulator